MTTLSTLHAATPTLAAIDSRGALTRTTAYYRRAANERAESRITRQRYDVRGHLVAQWDPRLWALAEKDRTVPANQTSTYDLSSRMLASTNVDSGWRVSLSAALGESSLRWDSRGTAARSTYDDLLRPRAVFEQASGESERCIERFGYAGSEATTHNLCSQLIRQDDPAGTLTMNGASLIGGVSQQSRRFLVQETSPNWPVEEDLRDGLVEPGKGALTRHAYSALSDPLQQTDAKGNCQKFSYSVAGQLVGASLQPSNGSEQVLLSAVIYNAIGQMEQETAGNDVTTTAVFSSVDGRLKRLSARKNSESPLQDLTYRYDPLGYVLEICDAVQITRHYKNQRIAPVGTYGYDTLYQLIEATGREADGAIQGPALPNLQPSPVNPNQLLNYTQQYEYDAGGNLMKLRHVGAQSYTRIMDIAAHSNQSVVQGEHELARAFDANGNLRELQPGQTLSWDVRNQLSQITPVERHEAANDAEIYTYDATGQRLRKIRHTQASSVKHRLDVRYLPGLELRTNTATDENLHVINITVGRNSVRMLHWETGHTGQNDQLRYSLNDHLGSSCLELNHEAQLISQEGYYPYGGTAWWAGNSAIEVNYKTVRYSGKERDASGLYYYGLRYYAPWLNRWINPDPGADIDGLNLFRFNRNCPVSWIDPDGRAPTFRGRPGGSVEKSILKSFPRINFIARGLEQFKSQKNSENTALAEKFYQGQLLAKIILEDAIDNISNKKVPAEARLRLFEILGGTQPTRETYDALKTDFEVVLKAQNQRFIKGNDQVVIYEDDSPMVIAFTMPSDIKHKRIFVKKSYLDKTSITDLAVTLIHEESHIELKTADIYYAHEIIPDYPDDASKIDAVLNPAKKAGMYLRKNLGNDAKLNKLLERDGANYLKVEEQLKAAMPADSTVPLHKIILKNAPTFPNLAMAVTGHKSIIKYMSQNRS